MSILRVAKDKDAPYFMVSNEMIQRPDLSMKAKGLHCYLMSLPDDWKIYIKELQNHFTDGRDSITAAVKELQGKGYIKKTHVHGVDGKFEGWDYDVFESLPKTGFPKLEKPKTVNPQLLNTKKILNTNLTKSKSTPEKTSQEEEKKPSKADEAFDRFWKAYPRRVSKGNARRAFKKHKCHTFIEKILAAIEKQRHGEKWLEDKGKYIQHPASWLNSEGWENEVGLVLVEAKKKVPQGRRLDLMTREQALLEE